MKLYLSSYRLGNKTEELKNLVKYNKNEVLVIPNALDIYPDGEKKDNLIKENCRELENIGIHTKVLDLKKYFNKPEMLLKEIENYNTFYVLGGNAFILRTAMKLSKFDEYLKSINNNDNYLYIGYSAGICVLVKDMHGLELVEHSYYDPYNYGSINFDGLDLLDYFPVPHCDNTENPRLSIMCRLIKYFEENDISYKPLKDGDVILDNTNKNTKVLKKK